MSSVTFSITVGGDGSTVTDDSNPTTGLANGGHRTRFIPALSQCVAVASFIVTQANAAALSASQAAAAATLSVLNAAAVTGTSTTSLMIANNASKTLTSQTGKSWLPGMLLMFFGTPTQWMLGICTAYNSGTGSVTIQVSRKQSVATIASWTISIATAIPAQATVANSATSMTIAKGIQSFTCDADCSYVPGTLISIYNSSGKQMAGTVTTYNADTGALVANVTWIDVGTGTYTAWVISISTGVNAIADQIAYAVFNATMLS